MQTQRFMFDHRVTQDSLAEVVLAATRTRNAIHERCGTAPRCLVTIPRLTGDRSLCTSTTAAPRTTAQPPSSSRPPSAAATSPASQSRSSPRAHGLEHHDGVAAFGEANFPTAHHRHVGRQLWQRAGVKPEHIPVAQFYENFTGPVLMAISEMGFCEPGEINDFVADGNLQWPDGRLPINTSGGNLGEAYIHGFDDVAEAVDVRLTEVAAARVDRQPPVGPLQVAVRDEVVDLARSRSTPSR